MSTLMAVRLSNYADHFCRLNWQGTEEMWWLSSNYNFPSSWRGALSPHWYFIFWDKAMLVRSSFSSFTG